MSSNPVISDALAREVISLLEKFNGEKRYWDSLYWEFQEDAAQIFIRVVLIDNQNTPENIQSVTCLLRSVLSPLLPSSDDRFTWCAAVVHEGEHVGGVMGGMNDDWKYLGMDA